MSEDARTGPLAMVNGTVTSAGDAVVPATYLWLMRGDGVFEVVELHGGTPFALEEHLRRLQNSASALDLVAPMETIRDDVRRFLVALGRADGDMLLILTRDGTRVL